ncbi:DsbA family protein [Phyllobacterium sp. LjRoot231]|uniref:DsbA family protein n=1 Tax=Phyllobacterium sp. LjRoot231 TaxID=3342289 RepID=UPI003ECED54A
MMPDAPDPQLPGSASDPAANTEPSPLPVKPARSLKPLVFGSLILAGVSALLSALALLFAAGVLPPLRDAGFERQVRSYLLANPDVIVESVNGMEARQKATEENELTLVLAQRHDDVFNDPASPVGANPQGDATLVEFFDYNCPYCRKATPMLDGLEQADKGLRLVFKEYPILGPGSVFAARAALASQKQGKYLAFHKAMMTYKGQITENSSLEIAAQVGLDVERLKKDMEDPAIDEAINRNRALAGVLRISGTPTFVAGKEILRGLVDVDTLKQLIASVRGG